jgi:hypothetical protein
MIMKKYTFITLSLILLVIFIFTISYASKIGGMWVVADCLVLFLSIIFCVVAIKSNGPKVAGGLTVAVGVLLAIFLLVALLCTWLFGLGG